ncbi:MAG: polyprenyl synthetase family protein [Bacteroidetes bacterium]|nr:polyprenyl synthetase family protein [Bacteroidota bacterium]MBS1628645.1 polyprenyl synthetase family protein [Bacteroidota bacterium]
MHRFSELAAQFEAHLSQSGICSGQPDTLYEPCRYLLSLGGKRIRPTLCLMGAELFDALSEEAFHAALAIELFHNFTLVHDDIMDKAPLRRGRPTIHARNGLTAGILCGDLLCIEAYSQLSKLSNALPQVLRMFNQTAAEVCEGQQLDMDFEPRQDVRVEEYIRMIELKTSVLLAASLKMGALIGGATGQAADKLYTFGRTLGIAFQLQDDYLDAFGDSDKLGKQTGGDILADKKTFLHLKAMEHLDEKDRQTLMRWQGREGAEKLPHTLELFRKSGADERCREAVAAYSQRAFDALEEVAVLSKRKHALKELAEMLLLREA